MNEVQKEVDITYNRVSNEYGISSDNIWNILKRFEDKNQRKNLAKLELGEHQVIFISFEDLLSKVNGNKACKIVYQENIAKVNETTFQEVPDDCEILPVIYKEQIA